MSEAETVDLRGKTVQIMMTRDHSLEPDLVQKFNEKWKQYGAVRHVIAVDQIQRMYILAYIREVAFWKRQPKCSGAATVRR